MVMIQDVKKIYLCDLNLQPITELNGIQRDSVSLSQYAKDIDQLTFTVDEYVVVDGAKIKSNGYDSLDIFMTLYLEDVGMFQMQKPAEIGDGTKNYKTVLAYSLEKEWDDKSWMGFKVNTGEEDSLEQLATGNLNDLGFAKEFVTFYNTQNHELSFIHLLLEKLPGWSVEDDDIDRVLWNKKIPSMSVENTTLYNLCVAQIGPRMECLFMFDTIHRRIKVIAKTSLNDKEYETGVFIGYRNLANQIDVTVDEDSVFTRFNCRGDGDLGILNINYQDLRIFDLSYFMRQPYMSDALVSKVNTWITFREGHREEYIQLSKKWAEYNEAANELEYRVPSDDLNIDQWDDMNEEGLNESLKYYNTLLTSLQVSVDPDWKGSGNNYDGYVPWKKEDGSVDHERYLEALWNQDNGYGGYYTYYDVLNYVIPNIEIALKNLNLPDDDKQDYIDDWETNWDLYGVTELKAKKEDYNNQLKKLKDYAKPWDELTEDEKKLHTNEDNYNIYHNQYVEISEAMKGLDEAIKERESEKQDYLDKMDEITKQRNALADKASLDNKEYGFTTKDLITIHSLFHDTDYQNTNIISTSIDTSVTEIDREKELYNDSVSKLSEVSQPQYKFAVQLDNLFRIEEFKHWKGDVQLLKFIRLGIKDDYSVKVRIIGITWNPCEITPDITLEFSSMITSRSGRTDLTDLLNSENNRGSENSISIGTGNSDSDKEYLTKLLQLMINTGMFKDAVGDIAGGTTGVVDELTIQRLFADYIKSAYIDVDHIVGDKAEFQELFAKYIDSEYIVTQIIQGENGDFIDFINGHMDIHQISTDLITGRDGNTFIDFLKNEIQTSTIKADQITGIEDSKTFIDFVNNTIATSTIQADKIVGLDDSQTFIDFVNNQINTSTLTGDLANIKTILSGSAGVGDLQAINLTTQNAVIDEAVVKSMIASKMTVADLSTHTASAELITLIGKDGNPTIAFKDSTQQFYDADGNVRVQIGQDGNGDFNFIVRGSDGTTAMFDENGITKDGIPNNTIINNMIADGTIEKGKLGFEIIEPNEYGGIDISQIYLGDGGQFGADYSSFKDNINNDVTKLNEKIEASSSYSLYIEMPNGNVVTPGGLNMIAHLFRNSVEVSDEWDDTYFTWTRHSSDEASDLNWNNLHKTGTKQLYITRNDVMNNASFQCKFETDDLLVISMN